MPDSTDPADFTVTLSASVSAPARPTHGWVWLQGQLTGSLENWTVSYSWDMTFHATREAACDAGLAALEHDDFTVAQVHDGALVWFGWFDQELPAEDRAAAAAQFGWRAPGC